VVLREFAVALAGFVERVRVDGDDGVELVLVEREAVRYWTRRSSEVTRFCSMAARISGMVASTTENGAAAGLKGRTTGQGGL